MQNICSYYIKSFSSLRARSFMQCHFNIMFLRFLRIPTSNQYKIKMFCPVKNTRANFDFLKNALIKIKCLDIIIA